MKKLIIINGTMGVGKTTICEKLCKETDFSVWLDGDWCWMMNPWIFSKENKKMVIENIVYLLRNYLSNSTFQYIIFSWVIHREEIMDLILERISDMDFKLMKFTLTCSEATLVRRHEIRCSDINLINDSIDRLKNYHNMDTIKINTDNDIIENICILKQLIQQPN